jgi:PAS domain-containing protein
MDAKSFKKLFFSNKSAIEFIIALFVAAVLFFTLHFLGIFDEIRQYLVEEHQIADVFFAAVFLAAALSVFSFTRLLELKKAHKTLAQSDQQLMFQSKMLDEIGDSVLATDLDGKITYVNQAQCNWKNKSKNELLGQSVRVFDMDDSLGQVQQEIIRTTREKG